MSPHRSVPPRPRRPGAHAVPAGLGLVVALGVTVATVADAAPPVPDPTEGRPTIVGATGTPGDATLVGRDGEIYRRVGDAWRRPHGGGVASPLRAVLAAAGEVWGVGERMPTYRWERSGWFAVRGLPRGEAVPAVVGSPAVAVAIGRRVLVRDAAGRTARDGKDEPRWRLLPRAPAEVDALWAGGRRDVVAVAGRRLVRWDGRRWRSMSLPARKRPVTLVAAGEAPLVIAHDGALLAVRGRRARPVPLDATLAGLRPKLGAPSAAGATLLGILPDGRRVLARVEGERLVLDAALPALATDDEAVGLLIGADGAALIATRRGAVLARPAGGTFATRRVDPRLAIRPRAANPPARVPGGKPIRR